MQRSPRAPVPFEYWILKLGFRQLAGAVQIPLSPFYGLALGLCLVFSPHLSAQNSNPEALQWHPDSQRITWVESQGERQGLYTLNLRGERELLFWNQEIEGASNAESPAAPKRDLSQGLVDLTTQNTPSETAPLALDQALPLRDYTWSPTGKALVLQDENDFYFLNTQNLQVRALTQSPHLQKSHLQWSPNGQWLLFAAQGGLHLQPIAGGAHFPITPFQGHGVYHGQNPPGYQGYPTLGDGIHALFSPQSDKIAFLTVDIRPCLAQSGGKLASARKTTCLPGQNMPQFSVSVVDLEGKRLAHYQAPVDQYLAANLAFTPDGDALAITEIDRDQASLTLKRLPLDGGTPITLFEEEMPNWLSPVQAPVFLDGGKNFLWMSPYYGYIWPYLGKSDGPNKKLKKMVRVPWNLQLIHVDNRGKHLYFKGSGDEYTETHLFRLKQNGGGFTRLTLRWGVHDVLVSPDGRAFVDRFSDLETPPETTLWKDRKKVATLSQAPAPSSLLNEKITLQDGDRIKYQSLLHLPRDYDKRKRYPLVIRLGDGPGQQHIRDRYDAQPLNQALTDAGFLVFQMDMKGSGNRKHRFQGAIDGQPGVAELENMRLALDELSSYSHIDMKRVHLIGEGYGAYLALYFAAAGLDIQSITTLNGLSDWKMADQVFAERYLNPPALEAWQIQGAAELLQGGAQPPLYILHQIAGAPFEISHAQGLFEAAQKQGRSVQFTPLAPPQSDVIQEGSLAIEAITTFLNAQAP